MAAQMRDTLTVAVWRMERQPQRSCEYLQEFAMKAPARNQSILRRQNTR